MTTLCTEYDPKLWVKKAYSCFITDKTFVLITVIISISDKCKIYHVLGELQVMNF